MKKTAMVWMARTGLRRGCVERFRFALAQQAPAEQAPAAASTGARIITFQEAIRIALEQNVTVRAAQNTAALGEVGVSEARAQFLPNLTASTNGARNYGRTTDTSAETAAGQVVNQTTTSMSLGVNSGVVLFDGLGNIAQLRSAKLSSAASEEELRRARRRWRSMSLRAFSR